MSTFSIEGQLIDVFKRRIYPAAITISSGKIASISELPEAPKHYILPGFVDAHVHIESSMLTPAAFAQLAVQHGTVATVSDPHEIANVCGIEGIDWMIENASGTPFKCFFGAPSCVPATNFETVGACLDAAAVAELLKRDTIWYLSEMMNYPGVLHSDPEVMAKLQAAKLARKPIDGHAPGLRADKAKQYANAGISTDHECTTLAEAQDKIAFGMHILIREGSAAKNFDALHPLFTLHPEKLMFCSDDKHPDDLVNGHINQLVKRALGLGYNLFDVLWAACVNPVLHYNLPVGLLREGDPADFILVPNLEDWKPSETYLGGKAVYAQEKVHFDLPKPQAINKFEALPCATTDIQLAHPAATARVNVIVAEDGQLVTQAEAIQLKTVDGHLSSDPNQDVLKLVVLNRYAPSIAPAVAFIKGFRFHSGAIASTVAHDCHNIIAVGVEDACICSAINAVIAAQGGIAVARTSEDTQVLPLPIAGLISDQEGHWVATHYSELSQAASALGSSLHAPFMTLSFMALLVIPSLKLSDKGLFDGHTFQFCPLVK